MGAQVSGSSLVPVAVMKNRRPKEEEERSKEEIARQFQFQPFSEIEELLDQEDDLKSSESGRSEYRDKSDD